MATTRNTILATAGLVTMVTMATPALAQETTPANPETPTIVAETNTKESAPAKEETTPAENTPGKETTPEISVDENGNVLTDIDGEKKTITTEDEAKTGENPTTAPKTEEKDDANKTTTTFESKPESPLAKIYNGKVEFTPEMTNDAAIQVKDKINEKYLAVKDQVEAQIKENKDPEITAELTKIYNSVASLNDLGDELATPIEKRLEGRTDEVIKKEMADAAQTIEESLYALQEKGIDTNALVEDAVEETNEAETTITQEQDTKAQENTTTNNQSGRGILASTGASILGIVALGAAVAGAGIFFLRRKNS